MVEVTNVEWAINATPEELVREYEKQGYTHDAFMYWYELKQLQYLAGIEKQLKRIADRMQLLPGKL